MSLFKEISCFAVKLWIIISCFAGNKSNLILNPDFFDLTVATQEEGLTDACFAPKERGVFFSLQSSVFKSKGGKYKINVHLGFTIKMLKNETELLSMIKYYFNCGILWHYHRIIEIWVNYIINFLLLLSSSSLFFFSPKAEKNIRRKKKRLWSNIRLILQVEA